MSRSSGVLLSVTSLPSKYGIGCFSKEAYAFVDWLKDAGQTFWQTLPPWFNFFFRAETSSLQAGRLRRLNQWSS